LATLLMVFERVALCSFEIADAFLALDIVAVRMTGNSSRLSMR
jgi:hypothetical protein